MALRELTFMSVAGGILQIAHKHILMSIHRSCKKHNYAFEADAVKQRAASCYVRAPRGSTQRYVSPS
jgi:hypothetical protein